MHNLLIKVLLVEDNPDDVKIIEYYLAKSKRTSFEVEWVNQLSTGFKFLSMHRVDVILLDLFLSDSRGMDTFKKVYHQRPDIPIIILTSLDDEKLAIEAAQCGAQDYFTKGEISERLLERAIRYAIERKQTEKVLLRKSQEIEEDLTLSTEIQQFGYTELSDMSYLKTAQVYMPHSRVSGDIYDVTINHFDHYNIFLGDVTGHGVSAALITMMVRMGLRHISTMADPENVVTQLNQKLATLLDDKFVSALYVRFTPEGRLIISNAGHPPLIIIPDDGSEPKLIKAHGFPLGFFKDKAFSQEEYQLQDRDKVFLYTDGVTEVEDSNNEQFSVQRLTEFLHTHRMHSIHEILSLLVKRVQDFSPVLSFGDDFTIIGCEYVDPFGVGNQKHLQSAADREHLMRSFERLKESRLFQRTPEQLIKQLVPVSRIQHYEPGETILKQGEMNDSLFVLVDGCFGVYANGKLILKLRRTGDVTGEMSIISESPTAASVVAEKHCDVLVVSEKMVKQYDLDEKSLQGVLYKVFSMILTEKLKLTTKQVSR